MNEYEARVWNAAIDAAAREYKRGISAIQSLKVRYAVTVEHVSPYHTNQEVKELDED